MSGGLDAPAIGLYALLRPLLFRLDAERSHRLTLALLARFPALGGLLAGEVPDDPVEFCGLRLRNRIGLAAGLDKDGEAIAAFSRMGFGFIEVGTVTPRPQPGNPRPRLFRLPQAAALINRMGFNNHGVEALLPRLHARPPGCVVGVNLGKNADTPLERAVDDYLLGLRAVVVDADFVTLNLSSPNTAGLRNLQAAEVFEPLLRRVLDERDALVQRHGRACPLLVKIAPDLSGDALTALAELAVRLGVDGLIATNTTLARPDVTALPHAAETGGLSGAPLRELTMVAMQHLRRIVGPHYPLVGVGGILDGESARARRHAGADLLQIYSGLVYRGPGLIGEIGRSLTEIE
jgi:dihydroorotate oxidase A (EC 1.3.3.1)